MVRKREWGSFGEASMRERIGGNTVKVGKGDKSKRSESKEIEDHNYRRRSCLGELNFGLLFIPERAYGLLLSQSSDHDSSRM
jgi:hypothetical protein